MMNITRIKCGWREFKGNVKWQWCRLTDDRLVYDFRESNGISSYQMAVWREHQRGVDHRN